MMRATVLHRQTRRLSRFRRIAVYTVGVGVWLTGAVWLWLHYFVVYRGLFGATVSPVERWSLTFHGAFAFAAIWVFGLLWGAHVPEGWSGNKRRLSGAILVGLLGWLIVSGYLLYYVGDDRARAASSIAHWVIGLMVPVGFLAHRYRRGRRSSETAMHQEASQRARGLGHITGLWSSPTHRYARSDAVDATGRLGREKLKRIDSS